MSNVWRDHLSPRFEVDDRGSRKLSPLRRSPSSVRSDRTARDRPGVEFASYPASKIIDSWSRTPNSTIGHPLNPDGKTMSVSTDKQLFIGEGF
ncbi:hypothetical protein DLM46_13710 [Paraburkholderia lacunae]|uniref:Uncharacterized protein n=1 Tax=Paraburkholderia lacunae TaxID=2211104 RepID=A0A370N906_9BURK|nr:hypothetical protein DLM46_13710 [Paraburkholderia lacunae]